MHRKNGKRTKKYCTFDVSNGTALYREIDGHCFVSLFGISSEKVMLKGLRNNMYTLLWKFVFRIQRMQWNRNKIKELSVKLSRSFTAYSLQGQIENYSNCVLLHSLAICMPYAMHSICHCPSVFDIMQRCHRERPNDKICYKVHR